MNKIVFKQYLVEKIDNEKLRNLRDDDIQITHFFNRVGFHTVATGVPQNMGPGARIKQEN